MFFGLISSKLQAKTNLFFKYISASEDVFKTDLFLFDYF